MKIYEVGEIERVLPINRWRHAVISLKNRMDDDSPTWRSLKEFLNQSRKEFKKAPADFVSGYF